MRNRDGRAGLDEFGPSSTGPPDPSTDSVYTSQFYDRYRDGSRRSAGVVVPLVLDLVAPVSSVLDVGCGVGTWLAEFARQPGVDEVFGVDGEYVSDATLEIPATAFRSHDLSIPLDLGRRFDLTVSVEVAEHLDRAREDQFVDTLVRHSDAVLFSAAIPGQGGTHHVNEQWPSHWASMFATRGFELFDVVRGSIWHDNRIDICYRQNLLVFATGAQAETMRARREALGMQRNTSTPPLDIAHPELLALRVEELHRAQYQVRQATQLRTLLRALPAATGSSFRHHLLARASRH